MSSSNLLISSHLVNKVSCFIKCLKNDFNNTENSIK